MTEDLPYRQRLALIRNGLAEKTTKAKEKKPLKKVSDKKAAEIKAEKEERGDGDTELQKWFKERMKVMGNTCNECGCKVENKIYQYAIMSICHLLAKRDTCCPSVKTHPMNYITLCVDHHHMFDNSSWEEKEMMGCWETVRDRLVLVYPSLAESERRHFPESVLKFMEKNKS